jgi:hypothetical protein
VIQNIRGLNKHIVLLVTHELVDHLPQPLLPNRTLPMRDANARTPILCGCACACRVPIVGPEGKGRPAHAQH